MNAGNKSKRVKIAESEQLDLVPSTNQSLIISETSAANSSKLQGPTVALTGHSGPVFSISFSPDGHNLASASLDESILLWDAFGENKNYNILTGHKNAVLNVKWLTNQSLVSVSADKLVSLWDANKGVRIRKYAEHDGIVNTCSVCLGDPNLFISGSDDGKVLVWDVREKGSVSVIECEYPVLSSCLNESGSELYIGGIDNTIVRWNLRGSEGEVEQTLDLAGHTDAVTGLALSPDGNHLLSNGMDGHLFQWDVRPFVLDEMNRCEQEFEGVKQSNEKNLLKCAWSPDQEYVTCGSADSIVKVWSVSTGKLLYYLPGHKGSVNDVIFHPTVPGIIASCGTDRTIFLGELV